MYGSNGREGADNMGNMTKRAQVGDIIKLPGNVGRHVVERAEMEGGGIGHTPKDRYPDGHHVTARQLNEDGSYNASNPTVVFYQSGEFDPATTKIIPEVQVIGKMNIPEPVIEEELPVPPEAPEVVEEVPPTPPEEPTPVEDAPEPPEEPVAEEEPVVPPEAPEEPEPVIEAPEEPAVTEPPVLQFGGTLGEALGEALNESQECGAKDEEPAEESTDNRPTDEEERPTDDDEEVI
jgi:hypothetical protein